MCIDNDFEYRGGKSTDGLKIYSIGAFEKTRHDSGISECDGSRIAATGRLPLTPTYSIGEI